MEKIWCYKSPRSLTDNKKNEILEKVFNAVICNEMCENIGEEIVYYLMSNGYVFEVEVEEEED